MTGAARNPCSLYTLLQILEVNLLEKKRIALPAAEALKQVKGTTTVGNQLKLFRN
jgi:hypothetical protein